MDKENQAILFSGRGPVAGHYRTLTKALAVAMPTCVVWRETESGAPYTAKELFAFCEKHDAEHPLRPEQFYMVSREGAIGLSPGLEWLTTWMFIPMEEGKERDFAFRNMVEELHTEIVVERAIEQAVKEGLAREKTAAGQVSPLGESKKGSLSKIEGVAAQQTGAFEKTPQSSLFCPYCGAKLEAGTVFCGNCGSKIEE